MAQLGLCFLEKRISMKCIKSKDKIEIIGLEEFNINQIFDCGQIFRYQIIDNEAIVVSKNHFASIKTNNDIVQITTKDVEYFEKFFDWEGENGINPALEFPKKGKNRPQQLP